MSRPFEYGTLLSRAHILATIGVAVGCGMRGPPLPPLVFVPAAVASLEIQRFDDDVFIHFEVPSANTDGSELADLERVEVYALTTQPDPEQPDRPLPLADWLDHATMVATIPVVAIAPDASADSDSETVRSDAVRPGDEVTLVEVLTPEVMLPVVIEAETVDEDDDDDEAQPDERVTAAPFVVPPPPSPPRRTYVAIGVSRRGRESPPSQRISVTLGDPTSAPSAPTVTYTEAELVVEWVAPSTARLPIQEPVIDASLGSEPVVRFPEPTRYLVYVAETSADAPAEDAPTEDAPTDEDADGGIGPPRPEPLNLQPATQTSHVEIGVAFGAERCYTVRALDIVDSLPVRGPASPPTCVTPIDTFAPQAPAGVVAVASRDAISLVWDPSPEPDVAGYRVLRGTAPGATLQSLTAEPIVETTYRDPAVESGRRYVYAVQAVDDAAPPNVSPPSVEVMEQAR